MRLVNKFWRYIAFVYAKAKSERAIQFKFKLLKNIKCKWALRKPVISEIKLIHFHSHHDFLFPRKEWMNRINVHIRLRRVLLCWWVVADGRSDRYGCGFFKSTSRLTNSSMPVCSCNCAPGWLLLFNENPSRILIILNDFLM